MFGERFLLFLQGLITAGYKTIKSQNTVFVRVGGEGGSDNSGGWVLRLSLQRWKGGRGLKPEFVSMSWYELRLVHIKSPNLDWYKNQKFHSIMGGGRCTSNTFSNFILTMLQHSIQLLCNI